jgi:cytochrome b subunit of formate dehydrogenase
MSRKLTLKKAIAWTLLAVTLLFLLSGWGISQYQIVTPLTFGLLGKAQAFQVHEWLWVPFGALLLVHVYLGMFKKKI